MKIKGSIRRRLVISLVLLAIIPLFLLGALLSWQSYVIQQRQLVEMQKEKARRVLNQISSLVHEQEQLLKNALAIDLYIIESGNEKQRLFLSQLISFSNESGISIFNELALLDNRGRELASESRTSIVDQKALGERSNADEFTVPMASRQTYYGPVYIDSKTGAPFMLISIPIIDSRSNNLKGVLSAKMRMKFMWDIVDKINIGESGTVYIVDSANRVIVHPNPSVVLKGDQFDINTKSGPGKGLDGEKAILTHDILELGDHDLHIFTEVPLIKALRSTYTSLITIAVFLVLTLTGAVILGIIIIRQIIRPVESLAETAQAISSGDISRRSEISRDDELGALSDTFNLMTSRLADTITSLKNEVAGKEQAKSKIRLAYEEWQRTFDSISQPVSIHDKEYRIIRANKAFSDFFKKSFHDLIGKKCFEIFHCSNEPFPNCPHTTTLDTGLNCSEELFEPTLNRHLRVTTSPILDHAGEITGSVHITEDITERKHTELALKESHERLLLVLDSLEAIVYVADMQTHEVLFANNYTRQAIGDIEGRICWQTLQVNQNGPCAFCTNDKLLTPDGKPAGIYTWEFQNTLNGKWYYIKDRAIEWVDGRIVRMEIATDITTLKETETQLIKEKNLFKTMIEGLPGAFYIFTDKGKFLRWNRNFEQVSGYSSEEMLSINALDLFTEQDKARVAERIAEVFIKGQSHVEANVYTKDRREIPYLLTGCRCEIDNIPCLIGLGLDISERKKAEDRIMESLQEKEILLKEIHHRTKNNMQVISSLLNMQSGKLKGKPEAEVFNESRNRITAMALVHEKLYRSPSLGKIDFNDYITSLASSLFAFYGKSTRNISVRVHADGVFLGIDTAIPCGLIINELISNSLKYAFPDDRHGAIVISLKDTSAGNQWDYELLVSDDGIGLPEGINIRKTASLGLQLVTNLAEHQLQGTVELMKNVGTEFRIQFKEPIYKSRL